jgi:hypothetical protein
MYSKEHSAKLQWWTMLMIYKYTAHSSESFAHFFDNTNLNG